MYVVLVGWRRLQVWKKSIAQSHSQFSAVVGTVIAFFRRLLISKGCWAAYEKRDSEGLANPKSGSC
jgi:hypothetical protein